MPETSDDEGPPPSLSGITWIHVEEKGRINVTTGKWSGHEYVCAQREGRWAVLEIWQWIS